MNLVEQLLRVDKEKLSKKKTKKMKSKRLSYITGSPAEITIRQLSGRKLNDIAGIAIDKNGETVPSKYIDANFLYCAEGIVEPNLKDDALLEHFGCGTPKELAELLFDTEANDIAGEIVTFSGIPKESEKTVKN